MSSTATTPFSKKCEILSKFWLECRKDEKFRHFVEYNDLGLPLAYSVATSKITANEDVTLTIEETWDLLMGSLGIEDEGFSTLEELLNS